MRSTSFVASILLFLTLAGCASMQDPEADLTVEDMYTEAKRALDNGNYLHAVDLYARLEARFPYGPYTEQAQLESAFAYYKAGESLSAVSEVERFIKQHPRHENVDYAYYLRGLASFDPASGLLDKFANVDPAERDTSGARNAYNAFKELVERFPKSKYVEDAIQRMTWLREVLARHEVGAADYYMRREAWLAAANRAKYVVENYERTHAVGDALAIMVTAYRHMELPELAADAERLLIMNYPGRTPWEPGQGPTKP